MANITVRYWRIETEGPVTFEDALESISNKPIAQREVNIGEGQVLPVHVRLQDLKKDTKPYICGEFVRRTLTGNPPEATATSLKKLSIPPESGLGYEVAFAYHPGLKVLALEHTPHTLSAGRVLLYANMASEGFFKKVPIVAQPAWERYKKSKPRKLQVTIANPENLAAVEGETSGVLSATSHLREMFEAPVITIEVSMGHKKGWLNLEKVQSVLEFFTDGAGKTADVRMLRASVKPDDDAALEDLDFLEEMLVSKETIDLDGTPGENYKLRSNYVRLELSKKLPYIQNVYGDKDA